MRIESASPLTLGSSAALLRSSPSKKVQDSSYIGSTRKSLQLAVSWLQYSPPSCYRSAFLMF